MRKGISSRLTEPRVARHGSVVSYRYSTGDAAFERVLASTLIESEARPGGGNNAAKRRQVALTVAAMVLIVVLTACTSERSYQGAAVGGGIGAVAGALLDRNNGWRGAVLGGTLGALMGGTLTEIASRASEEAAQKNQPVVYQSQDGYQKVESTPVGYDAQTRCHKVRERIYQNNKLLKDQTKEICESTKTEPTY